jgi:UDP-N-acetylglucosamine 4,6-dehydratase/5-epimerase
MKDETINWKRSVVLITGGTGSFGHAFLKKMITEYRPKKIIIFSRDEMKQYEMAKIFNQNNIRYFIGDVRDQGRLHRAFHGVDIVVHAAALKIVPAAEYNPFEAVKTNVIGAENIINAAIDNNVKKIIALSTDKAANPVNLYGATKLCAEKMFVAANNYSPKGTQFSVVRYGNVFGSRGSIVPHFNACKKNGVVPITDERMTRFWITLEQGVDFVISCIGPMTGGEVFIPKMPSMKITDLARVLVPRCRFKMIGVRPGEKLHETLVSADDAFSTIEASDRFIIYPDVVFKNRKRYCGKRLGEDFSGYRSDNNTWWLTDKELKKMIKKND